MDTFGNRLYRLRTIRKLTQQQLADALGISKSTVSLLERDQRKPSLK